MDDSRYRLLYVSSSKLADDEADAVVDAIVAKSQARNRDHGITGALMFSGKSFAQILEGGRGPVLKLMANISRDARHTDVQVIEQAPVSELQFARWSMAYAGRSIYSRRLIDQARTAPRDGWRRRAALHSLVVFMRGMAEDHGVSTDPLN